MLLSLFTPCHDSRYLLEAFHSLKLQNYSNWEWIITPNGSVQIPEEIQRHPQVRVTANRPGNVIGDLKHFAASHGKGEVLIEFDSDDMLAPGILSDVADAAAKGADFIYSDDAVFDQGRETIESYGEGYGESHGWQHYVEWIYGRPYLGNRFFEPCARSLCEVYYSPDHIRCWSRKIYERVGGFRTDMAVGDDHRLIVDTYLKGGKFHHIKRIGYLYRRRKDNTVHTRNEEIQKAVKKTRQEFLPALIAEWCRRHDYHIHKLTSGKYGEVQKIPDKCGMIQANECLHFLNPEYQVDFFNQVYDKLVPGGWLSCRLPARAYNKQDPRAKTEFNLNSMKYYSDRNLAATNKEIRCRFQLVQNYERYLSRFYEVNDMPVIQADMVALKGQRQPGLVSI